MPFLLSQDEIADIQGEVAPQLGDDLCEVWRMPSTVPSGVSKGNVGVDKYGGKVTTGVDPLRPDQKAVRVLTYYARKSRPNMGLEQMFGGQIADIGNWAVTFNAADNPDIRGGDWFVFLAKRQEFLALGQAGWRASFAYAIGKREQPQTANSYEYRALTGGVSGTTEPTWPTTQGATVNDGTVQWLCVGKRLRLEVSDTGGESTIAVVRVVRCKEVGQ